MPDYTFDYDQFIIDYPQLAAIPEMTLQGFWDKAILFISPQNYGYLCGDQRNLAINLFTAHLAQISLQLAAGQTIYVVKGAAIDKVNLTLEPPPIKDQFQWWLNATPYGAELLVLLAMFSVGGFYIPSSCGPGAISGFRGADGRFG